jgi:hypothetical protein
MSRLIQRASANIRKRNERIEEFIAIVQAGSIHGYSAEQAERKKRFLFLGKCVAQGIAQKMGWAPGSFEIIVNPAGPAVSGDIHLYGPDCCVFLEPFFGMNPMLMYRATTGVKDYTGGTNRWCHYETLRGDMKELIERLKFAH